MRPLGETLLFQSVVRNYESDFAYSLAYLEYAGIASPNQEFHIKHGFVIAHEGSQALQISAKAYTNKHLPVLCSQSSHQNNANDAEAAIKDVIPTVYTGTTYVGYWDPRSFRFVGNPRADSAAHFQYSIVYSKEDRTITATSYSTECTQSLDESSKENCLLLELQTPYIPKADPTTNSLGIDEYVCRRVSLAAPMDLSRASIYASWLRERMLQRCKSTTSFPLLLSDKPRNRYEGQFWHLLNMCTS